MSLHDDLDTDMKNVFFNTDDFGFAGTYTPKTGSPFSINVLFDDKYMEANPNGYAKVQSKHDFVTVREADIPLGPKPEDEITIGATTYLVKTSESDGVGVLRLSLHKKP